MGEEFVPACSSLGLEGDLSQRRARDFAKSIILTTLEAVGRCGGTLREAFQKKR